MKLGYVRISNHEQNLDLQIEAIKAAGAQRIFEDHGISGAAVLKPAYAEMLRAAHPGDEIIIWRLDRLSRSISTLITELQLLNDQQLALRSLSEQIETVTTAGQSFFHIVRAFAQFESDVIRERADAVLAATKPNSKPIGRPPAFTTDQWQHAITLLESPHKMTVPGVAKLLGVSHQAIYKRLKVNQT